MLSKGKTKILKMKKINLLGAVALAVMILVSCSNDEIVNPDSEDNNKLELFKYSFEKSNEGFLTAKESDYTANTPVVNLSADKNHCGRLFTGTSKTFTTWKGYNFKGNDTRFLGLNMGNCKGVFNGVAKKSFKISNSLLKGKGRITFNYYRPGDFTGWGYVFKVYISKKEEKEPFKNSIVQLEPRIESSGWISYAKDLNVDLKSGDYTLYIHMVGAAAIDDISLIEKK